MMQKQPKRYRHLVWVVLTFQVVWSSVYAVSCFYPLDFYANRSIALGMVLLVTLVGLVMSYLQLIGIWLVFGPGRYLHRILFTVLACLAGMGVMWVAMHLSKIVVPNGSTLNDYNNSALIPAVNGLFKDVVLLFPFFFLLLQLPSALVRFIFGWQINWGDTPPQKRPLAISDLLVITTLIAAAVASGSWINFDDLESINSVMAIGIFWLPVLILFVLPDRLFHDDALVRDLGDSGVERYSSGPLYLLGAAEPAHFFRGFHGCRGFQLRPLPRVHIRVELVAQPVGQPADRVSPVDRLVEAGVSFGQR